MSSSTITQTRTTTRRLSLSLVAPSSSQCSPCSVKLLETFPSELIIQIIELVLLSETNARKRANDMRAMLTSCKHFGHLVEAVLYRTVVLRSTKAIDLFERTVIGCRSRPRRVFLEETVRTLAVVISSPPSYGSTTISPMMWQQRLDGLVEKLSTIVQACKGLKVVVLPCFWKFSVGRLVGDVVRSCPGLEELVLQSMDDSAPSQHTLSSPSAITLPLSLTRVRLCEPGDMWVSPLDLVKSLSPDQDQSTARSPSLEYLQLSRRANANSDNDEIFVNEILEILSEDTGRRMKKVVVSLFDVQAGPFSSTPDIASEGNSVQESTYQDTYIEQLLKSAQAVDNRIEIRAGRYGGDWAEEWQRDEAIVRGVGSLDFWN